jgi:superfamily II DNA helicase RecQ
MRQVKFFKVRLAPSELKADESWLNQFLATARIRKIVPSLVQTPREAFWSVYVEFHGDGKADRAREAASEREVAESALPDSQQTLFVALKEWRARKAAELGLPSYVVFHNKQLLAMARMVPTSVSDLAAIPGIGDAKIGKYAGEVLQVIMDWQRRGQG